VTERFSGPFVEMFEALRMGPTFARGRRDARGGHVRGLTVSGSLAVAQIRGPEDQVSRRTRIAVRAFGAAEWSRVEQELAAEARYSADLLAGRMPAGIDRVFAAAGLSLLPLSLDEIAMDCACGGPMPCKHVAAAVYALAAAIDADPFTAFAWRGRPRDELLDRLRRLRGALAVDAMPVPGDLADADGLPVDFWGTDTKTVHTRPAPPGAASRPDALLDQVDPPWPELAATLRPAYRAFAADP
jgi:uncharacterized Zn finger protein